MAPILVILQKAVKTCLSIKPWEIDICVLHATSTVVYAFSLTDLLLCFLLIWLHGFYYFYIKCYEYHSIL